MSSSGFRELSPLTELEDESDADTVLDPNEVADKGEEEEEVREELADPRRFFTRQDGDHQVHVLRTRYSHQKNHTPPYPTKIKLPKDAKRLSQKKYEAAKKKAIEKLQADHKEVDKEIRENASSEANRHTPSTLNGLAEGVSKSFWLHRACLLIDVLVG